MTHPSVNSIVGRPDWHGSVEPSDWLLDGRSVTKARLEFFSGLDWTQARIDLGPSVAGNPGPYWHVPHPEHETVHRLYPKFLQSKWLTLIQHALEEVAARSATIISDLQAERDRWRTAAKSESDGRARMMALSQANFDRALAAESSLSRIKEETAPFGWKLVPAEPTDEMCSAMVSRIEEAMCGKGAPFKWPDIEHMFDIYVDAIAAAPTLRSLGSTDRSGSEKTAESEHRPSTLNAETE